MINIKPGMINLLGRWATLKDVICWEGRGIKISLP